MRMRQANTTKEKKPLSKKAKKTILYSGVIGAAAVAVALIVTLSLVFGGGKTGPGEEVILPPPGGDTEVIAPPPPPSKPAVVLPMAESTAGKPAVLDKLVYNSSMNQWRTHNGMDFSAAEGTAVLAITDGTILSVEHTQLEASVVTIGHADGFVSIYKGLSTDVLVEEGDQVKSGDRIGSVAAYMPRERSEGAHLHLEIKENGKLIDPLTFLP
ncbi:MAG: M23 family metallopeptidase, partial [Firmicutes bacterium]|nr:M23 family metallopeptidase [Bacillota bacterium]